MALILDAGALIALERMDAKVTGMVLSARRAAVPIRTSSAVVAQIWRDGSKQARVARALRGVDEVALDRDAARRIGQLLGAARRDDVVDGAILLVATDGDELLTSDPTDLAHLAAAAGLRVDIVAV